MHKGERSIVDGCALFWVDRYDVPQRSYVLANYRRMVTGHVLNGMVYDNHC